MSSPIVQTFKEYSGDTKIINQEYQRTKGNLFFQRGSGFLGRLLAQVKFRWSEEVETAGINPTHLYWNPHFFEKLDKDTRITVLAHELWHLAMLHTVRRGTRNPRLWNIAGDHAINLLLKEHGYYMGGFPYIMDDKYIGWSTDDIYDDLIKNQPPGGGGGGGYQLAGDILEPESQDSNGNPITPEEAAAQATAAVVGAVNSSRMSTKPGDIPGELEGIVDKFLNPKLPWNIILRNFFNAMVEDIYSYARPNRRYEDPIMPGHTGREGLEHLMFGTDISGSITDEMILRFFSEGKFIHEELRPEAMTLVTFDTEVHDVFRLERDDPYDTFEITGRGGTDLEDLYRFAKEEQATALVIFTDLYVNIPEDPGFPVIWIVMDNPDAEVPYGKLIHLSEDMD